MVFDGSWCSGGELSIRSTSPVIERTVPGRNTSEASSTLNQQNAHKPLVACERGCFQWPCDWIQDLYKNLCFLAGWAVLRENEHYVETSVGQLPDLSWFLGSRWMQMAFDVSSRKAGDWDLPVTARTLKPKTFWKLQVLHWITSSWKLRKSKTDVAEAHTLILCGFEVAILRFNGSMQWPQNCSCSSMKKGQATSKHPRSMVRAHTARCLGMQPPCLYKKFQYFKLLVVTINVPRLKQMFQLSDQKKYLFVCFFSVLPLWIYGSIDNPP